MTTIKASTSTLGLNTILKNLHFYIPISVHFFLILSLTIYTTQILPRSILPTYLIFSAIFLFSTIFSLNTILRFRTGVFYYLLNILFLLGFWLKYSVQKITSLTYGEPIGAFVLNSNAEIRILWVVICGISGFILSQICSHYVLKKYENTDLQNEKSSFHIKTALLLLALALFAAFLNLKFNILLSGLKPSVILPFKGNAVYYLVLTRGIMFLFFFYCFRTYSNGMAFLGGLIASVCSIGVLSRMIIIIYFFVVFVFILQDGPNWRFKKIFVNVLLFLPVFGLFSYLTVLGSSGLRNIIYANQSLQPQNEIVDAPTVAVKNNNNNKSNTDSAPVTQYFNFKEKLQVYKGLALGRWIGTEGVMAVDSYPDKSFALLWDALKEKSYQGVSFYTKITNPGIVSASSTSKMITTSVPGPIAFFYYSGSRVFVFFAIFLCTLFFSMVEQLAFKYLYRSHAVVIFISASMVFDFFQFGISPLSFVHYWLFLSFLVVVFLFSLGLSSKRTYLGGVIKY